MLVERDFKRSLGVPMSAIGPEMLTLS